MDCVITYTTSTLWNPPLGITHFLTKKPRSTSDLPPRAAAAAAGWIISSPTSQDISSSSVRTACSLRRSQVVEAGGGAVEVVKQNVAGGKFGERHQTSEH